ncbi:tRNA dihydrouridine synthase [Thecaphora frezii]
MLSQMTLPQVCDVVACYGDAQAEAGPSTPSYDPDALQLAPHQLLTAFPGLNVCAPMVRYSKLPFRALVSRYDSHINFSPMILAKEFSRSQGARDAEMSTNRWERGTYDLTPGVPESSESAQRFLKTNGKQRQRKGDVGTGAGTETEGMTKDEARREAAAEQARSQRQRARVRGALVTQFASSTSKPLADACELVAKTVDGVDLNCGWWVLPLVPEPSSRRGATATAEMCLLLFFPFLLRSVLLRIGRFPHRNMERKQTPKTIQSPQQWAYDEELGCFLLRKPEIVRDMVRAVKARLGEDFCVSVKIRVDDDLQLTDQLVRTALHAGASILTIHGRTRHQASTHPVNLDAIRFAVDAANSCGFRTSWGSKGGAASRFADGGSGGLVPCVANGDVWSLEEAIEWRRYTGASGAMSARGLLANPALFAGYDTTPAEAISLFTTLATNWSLHTALAHRHLAYMLESSFENRSEAIHFNSLNSVPAMTDWLGENGYLGASLAHHADPLADLFGYRQPTKITQPHRLQEMMRGLGVRLPL